MKDNRYEKGVSFIVCCHNSERVIDNCISAITNQQNSGLLFEVLLVDNNCTDNTVHIAKSVWSRNDADLKVLKESIPGLSHARKRGLESARFEIVSFIDDDNIVEAEWVVKVYHLFEKFPEIGAIGSFNKPVINGQAPFWFEKYQHNYACGKRYPVSGQVRGKRKHLWGAGLSLRTGIIRNILFSDLPMYLTGRKNNHLSAGDDSEICLRCRLMGWGLWYESDLKLEHIISPERLNWHYLCELFEGFGYTYPVLNIYRRLIDNKSPLRYPELFFRKVSEFIFIILVYNFRLLFENEGKDYKLRFYASRGSVKGIFRLRGLYRQIKKNIELSYPGNL